MLMNTAVIRFKVEKGQLVPADRKDESAYKLFLSQVSEGMTVEAYLNESDPNHTMAQLARVHAMIRELSMFTGHTFDEMKVAVKQRAGLCLYVQNRLEHCKSFSDCTKEEISLAIETCREIGNEIGYYLA